MFVVEPNKTESLEQDAYGSGVGNRRYSGRGARKHHRGVRLVAAAGMEGKKT